MSASLECVIAAIVRAEVLAAVAPLHTALEELRRAVPPQLVTPAEAAQRLGLSLSSIRRRVADGSLPSVRTGRAVRIDLTAVRPASAETIAALAAKARSR